MNTFSDSLKKSLSLIDGFFTSHVVFQLMKLGMFEELQKKQAPEDLANKYKLDIQTLKGVLRYLVIQKIVDEADGWYVLSSDGREMIKHAGWFIELVGGYGPTLENLTRIMETGKAEGIRNGKYVALGSGMIDYYDVIPLVKSIIKGLPFEPKSILDIGCGIGSVIAALCQEYPMMLGFGVEPNKDSFERALQEIEIKGLSDRITIENSSAYNFSGPKKVDVIVSAFVLHEIAFQKGLDGVIDFLGQLKNKYHDAYFLFVEVHGDKDNYDLLRTPSGAYYRCYFLVHELTPQELLTLSDWDNLFERAGLEIISKETVDKDVDPTGLEVAYLLKYK